VVARRFEKVEKQVSPLAVLEVELCEERNRAIADDQVAEATLYLKGVTLRAKESSRDVKHSINLIADELARQVKRHRDKRRGRRDARGATPPPPGVPTDVAEGPGEAAATL
jgi:ribosome hibernation promoting factor